MTGVAFLLFISVVVASVASISLTRSSLDEFGDQTFTNISTSNDSALSSAMVTYMLSQYLRGNSSEELLRIRMDVLSTQLNIAETKFPDSPGEFAEESNRKWQIARESIELIIAGERDPELIESTFRNLSEARVSSKSASDGWLVDVYSTNLNKVRSRLETEELLFSIFAPIAAAGALIVLLLALRARGRTELELENRQLVRINEEKSHFVAQVSHELKTPLTSVIAFTDILTKNPDTAFSDRQSTHLNVIKRNADYLRLLVDDLVDVSQLESGQINIEYKEVDLDRLLEDLRTSFGPIVERKSQSIEIVPSKNSFVLRGDHLRLLQVLSNLIANASKYSSSGTTITVTVTTNSDVLTISVKDQGDGMTEVDKDRAFEKFYRGKSVNIQSQSGTGIGLAVSKGIVEAHAGSITIQDAVPNGAMVVINLPIDTSKESKDITSLFK